MAAKQDFKRASGEGDFSWSAPKVGRAESTARIVYAAAEKTANVRTQVGRVESTERMGSERKVTGNLGLTFFNRL